MRRRGLRACLVAMLAAVSFVTSHPEIITAASSAPNKTAAVTDQHKICRCFW